MVDVLERHEVVPAFRPHWGPGFVYLVKNPPRYWDAKPGARNHKIGMSVSPAIRARSLFMDLLHTIHVPNMRRGEMAIRIYLGYQRRESNKGEYYCLSERGERETLGLTGADLEREFVWWWSQHDRTVEEARHRRAIAMCLDSLSSAKSASDMREATRALSTGVIGCIATADDLSVTGDAYKCAANRLALKIERPA